MSSLAIVRAQVERRIPGALTVYERTAPEVFPTGIAVKEWAQARAQIRDVTTHLTATQTRIAALQESSEQERRKRYTELSASRFVGSLEAGLIQYDRFVTDDSLDQNR
jgi:hypothetical protein